MFGIVDSNQKISGDSLVLNLDASQLRSYPTSGSTWTDLSGTGRNVTLYNSPTFNSANGGGIAFNGTSQYGIVGGGALNGTGNFTVSVWVRLQDNNAGGLILSFEKTGINGWQISTSRFVNSDNAYNEFSVNLYWFPDSSNFVDTTGGYWYNYVGVVDYTSGKMTGYRNGVQAQQSNTVGSGGTGTSALWICAREIPDFYSSLRVSQIQRWNRAFTATEVTAHFNATKSRYGTLTNP